MKVAIGKKNIERDLSIFNDFFHWFGRGMIYMFFSQIETFLIHLSHFFDNLANNFIINDDFEM